MAGLDLNIERTPDDERSALENLPDDLFIRIMAHFHDPQAFFSLSATKYSFKCFTHQTRALLSYAILNMKNPNQQERGKQFYRLAAEHGSVEGMLVHSDILFGADFDGDTAAVEQLLRAALAREGDDQDENNFIVLYNSANAFSGARLKLAHVMRERCAEGEFCPEAESLLRSVIESGPTAPDHVIYNDAVITLAAMIGEGETGESSSPQEALELIEAVPKPDAGCYFMMGRLLARKFDETGEAARTAYTHFLRAVELDEGSAVFALCMLYQENRGIPEEHRPLRLFFSYVCLVVAAFKYDEYHAVCNVEQIESEQLEHEANHGGQIGDPGFWGPQFVFYMSIKRWVFREAMTLWMEGNRTPDGAAILPSPAAPNHPDFAGTLRGTMTLHEVLTAPLDDLALPEGRILAQDD